MPMQIKKLLRFGLHWLQSAETANPTEMTQMDSQTVARLNQINREFYRVTAGRFDESRQQAWPGWERLAGHLQIDSSGKPQTPLTVLDVGCGNGRFGRFLAQRFGTDAIRYHGLDSSPALLERAREGLLGLDATLEERDF